MSSKLLTAAALMAALSTLASGCNTGSRSSKPVYGPGTTGFASSAQVGSTAPGATPGGGTTPGSGASVGQFSAGPALGFARAQHTATTLPDGRVLVTGGSDSQGILVATEIFDPTTNTWAELSTIAASQADAVMVDPTGQFATARFGHTATLLGNGQVLIAGGIGVERMDAQGQPVVESLKTSYVFDPAANKYTRVGDLPANRGWHLAAPVGNGAAVVGGMDAQLATLTAAAVFNPTAGTWAAAGTTQPHTWGAMVTAGSSTIVVGGADLSQGQQGLQLNGFPTPRVERFDPQNNAFLAGTQNPGGDRILLGANASSAGGRAIFVGGQGVQGQQLAVMDTVEVFDATAGTWTPGPTLGTPRFAPEVAEVGTTGDHLIIGGVDGSGAPTAECELWGSAANSILGTVSMSAARVDHRAVTLQDGRILVIGGDDANQQTLDTTELHTR